MIRPSWRRRTAVIAVTLAATALTGAVAASSASAAPPWQTPGDTHLDPNSFGSLTFFDSTGAQIFGGSLNDAPFAAYALASGTLESGDTAAFLSAFLPDAGANAGDWTGSLLSGATSYPNSSAAAFENGKPLYTASANDVTLADFIAAHPNTSSDSAYQGIYELRLRTSNPGHAVAAQYAAADIKVIGSTWQVVYPGSLQSTTTGLAVTPSTKTVGKLLTLTAQVSPAAAGTVQFADGATNLGGPVTVASGTATKQVTPSTAGTHHYTATFTPTRLDTIAGSQGTADASVAKATSTTTGGWPTSVHYGTLWSVTATVTAPGVTPTGTVAVLFGSTTIGSATLKSGSAKITVAGTALTPGAHPLSLSYAGSANVLSSKSTKTISVAKAVSKTTNTLAHTTVKHTVHAVLNVVVTATGVTPTGTLTVFDGTSKLTTTTLTAANKGKRSITLPLISKTGKHTLHAVFGGSTTVAGGSAPSVTLTVTK